MVTKCSDYITCIGKLSVPITYVPVQQSVLVTSEMMTKCSCYKGYW